MKQITSVGLLFVVIFLIASSIIYNSGNKAKLSTKEVTSVFQQTSDSFNLIISSDSPYSAECNEQINFTEENTDSGIEKFVHSLNNQSLSRAKKLNQLNFISSRIFYQHHLAQMQSEGFYLYSLCKVLI